MRSNLILLVSYFIFAAPRLANAHDFLNGCSAKLGATQLAFAFEFPAPSSPLSSWGDWVRTPVFRYRSRVRINDVSVFSAPDNSGRFIVFPDVESGASIPALTADDQRQIDEVMRGTRLFYVVSSVLSAWEGRISLQVPAIAEFSHLPDKISLRRLGFEQIKVVRRAKLYERHSSYSVDGVVVMKARWGLSEITVLNDQKNTSSTEARAILSAILTGQNYTTAAAHAALKRGKIVFSGF